MENLNELIRENLVKFRKEHKLTQVELSKKINYTDKAISRWENGEVIPDIETLNNLSKIYEIPLTYFFEKHSSTIKKIKFSNLQLGNKLIVSLLAVICVWFIAIITFVYMKTKANINVWIVFVWTVPLSCIIGIIFNSLWGKRYWTFIFISILIWSLLIAIYLQMIKYNLYLIFVLGIPMQIGTVLWSCIKPKKHN